MTTTDNSRADALKDAVWRLKRDLERGNVGTGTSLVYMADLRILMEAVEQHEAAPADMLAHVKWLHYCLREAGHCIDGGKCHHKCDPKSECWRQDGCVPLTGSRLTDDWKLPASSAPLEGTGNGADERAVATVVNVGPGEQDMEVELLAPLSHGTMLYARAPRTEVAGAVQPSIEYRYEGGTFWCDLGPAERMRPDFKGVYRLKAGEFPVWGGDEPSADAAAAPADERAAFGLADFCELIDAYQCAQKDGTHDERAKARIALMDAYRAAASQPAAAAGQEARYALVPRVLTQAMDGAMHRAWKLGSTQHLWDVALDAAPQPPSADAAAEDKYVIERLSTVLAGVTVALLGEEADRPASETLQKLPEEAAKLRLELDLYRAQAADAAAAPADERAAFEAWYLHDMPHETYLLKRSHQHPEMYDDDSVEDAWTGWQARAAASQPAAAAGQEAVAIYQARQLSDEKDRWDDVSEATHSACAAQPQFYETRVVYTAPPAQVDTRQGLTEALRQAREELSNVEWENDPPARVTNLFSKIDALLEGAKR